LAFIFVLFLYAYIGTQVTKENTHCSAGENALVTSAFVSVAY